MVDNNITSILATAAEGENGIIYINSDGSETKVKYSDLYSRSLGILRYLRSRKLKKEDKVIFQFADNSNFIDCFWGCILGGYIPVPLPVCIDEEKKRKLKNVMATLDDPYILADEFAINILRGTFSNELAKIQKKVIDITHHEILESNKGEEICHDKGIAMIQFSSGSTGTPKGVQLSHKNIITNVKSITKAAEFNTDDTVLSWLPLTHDMGLIGAHITAMYLGVNQYIIPTNVFMEKPILWFDKISEHKITVTLAPNFAYKYMISILRKSDTYSWNLASLRYILNGAEPISAEVCDIFTQMMSKYGLRRNVILNVYGMAEATLAVAFSQKDEPLSFAYFKRDSLTIGQKIISAEKNEPGSIAIVDVGYPVPCCSVRIAGLEEDIYEEDVVGEIQIAGDHITEGYYKGDSLNENLFTSDGWLHSGDIGFIHNGKLYISGRYKEILFVNGQNFYPYDIEESIEKYFSFSAGSVAVCGVANQKSARDYIYLFVERLENEDISNVISSIRATVFKNIGLYLDKIIPVDKIPKTESGKIQRIKLKQMVLSGELKTSDMSGKEIEYKNDSELSETESKLIEICRSVLGSNDDENFGRNVAFMEIGLDSVKLVSMSEEINKSFNRRISITDIFANPTISDMARFLDGKKKERMPEVVIDNYSKIKTHVSANDYYTFKLNDINEHFIDELPYVMAESLRSLCKEEKFSFHCMCEKKNILQLYELKNKKTSCIGKIRSADLLTLKISSLRSYRCIIFDHELNTENRNLAKDYDITIEYLINNNQASFFFYRSSCVSKKVITSLAYSFIEIINKKGIGEKLYA